MRPTRFPRLPHVPRLAVAAAGALLMVACSSDDPASTPSEANDATTTTVLTPEEIGRQLPGASAVSTPLASDAAKPEVVPEFPGGAAGYSHFVFEDVAGEIRTTLVEGPAGEQTRYPLTMAELEAIVSGDAPIPLELGMSADEVETLHAELFGLREAVRKYADVDAARAAGYRQTTNEVPNMGAHFNRLGTGGSFDENDPDILMYGRDEDGDWQLIGTSFVVGSRGGEHPEGWTGPVDNWHMHYDLCSGNPLIVSRSASPEECRESGGFFLDSYGWMIHAWVAEDWDNPLGIFHMWNPLVPPLGMSAEELRQSRAGIGSESGPIGDAIADNVSPIIDFAFSTIEIAAGTEAVFTNADWVPHTVTLGSNGQADATARDPFDSGPFDPGDAFTHTFDEPGTYRITCVLHPQMNGTVIVE